jgi:hypothetical protein
VVEIPALAGVLDWDGRRTCLLPAGTTERAYALGLHRVDTEQGGLAAFEAAIQRVVEPARSLKDLLTEAPLDDNDLTRPHDSGPAIHL